MTTKAETAEEKLLLVKAMLALTKHNVPPDIQELLLFGSAERDVQPNAMMAVIRACLK